MATFLSVRRARDGVEDGGRGAWPRGGGCHGVRGGGETHLGGSVVEDREGGEIEKRSSGVCFLANSAEQDRFFTSPGLAEEKGSEVSGGVSGRAVGSRGELGSSGEPGRSS